MIFTLDLTLHIKGIGIGKIGLNFFQLRFIYNIYCIARSGDIFCHKSSQKTYIVDFQRGSGVHTLKFRPRYLPHKCCHLASERTYPYMANSWRHKSTAFNARILDCLWSHYPVFGEVFFRSPYECDDHYVVTIFTPQILLYKVMFEK